MAGLGVGAHTHTHTHTAVLQEVPTRGCKSNVATMSQPHANTTSRNGASWQLRAERFPFLHLEELQCAVTWLPAMQCDGEGAAELRGFNGHQFPQFGSHNFSPCKTTSGLSFAFTSNQIHHLDLQVPAAPRGSAPSIIS